MSDKPLAEAREWIHLKYGDGAKEIGVTCNPIQRKLFLIADKEKLVIDCKSQRETRILKDILHDEIGRLL